MKKYELTEETVVIGDKTLFRIRALRSFGDIKAGDLGGFIENEKGLAYEKGNDTARFLDVCMYGVFSERPRAYIP